MRLPFPASPKSPIFNEFDIWKPYDDSQLQDLNLYIVEASQTTLLFNKTYNLVFGVVLLKVGVQHVEILALKEPSSIIFVDYKKILQELYSQEISSSYDENTAIRKTDSSSVYSLCYFSNYQVTSSFISNLM